MPYELKGNCVYKQDGTLVKCHDTHKQAVKHLAALQLNVVDVEKKEYEDALSVVPTVDMSSWGLTPDQAQQTGTLLNLFNGKVHDAMTCVTDQLAMRGYLSEENVKIFTDLKGAMLKLFNESVPKDLAEMYIAHSDLQDIASKEYGIIEQPSLFVAAKELKDSPYDWVMITSSSYQDREGETISLKAHEQDIAWMEQTGNYGTLDWWHLHPAEFEMLKTKDAKFNSLMQQLPPYIQQHGLILGDCTFSAMYNKLRIEAGTYRSKEIKEIMQPYAEQDSGSLLFFHPKHVEPDAQGVYHNIRTVSRAIMPRTKVSNLASYLASAEIGVN